MSSGSQVPGSSADAARRAADTAAGRMTMTGMGIDRMHGWARDASNSVMTVGIVLAILYFGRPVLLPLALALMLSLLLAPLVRALRRLRVGHAASALFAVAALVVSCLGIATVLGSQIIRIAESLPQYQSTLQRKLMTLEEVAAGPLRRISDETIHLAAARRTAETLRTYTRDAADPVRAEVPGMAALQSPEIESRPLEFVAKLLTAVWRPVQFGGIVLIVLIFVLLEHESLRDRFIRIAGATDIRTATLALNDVGDRLSRFFASQFLVNLAFGIAVWACVGMLRLPQALLCGTLAGVLRFVPYVGVAIAAVFAAVLAAAVGPGWLPALGILGFFIVLDVIVAQSLEPHLYGHATGLSPLSVVVGAIFWTSLWGPAGLILSTPLTLCLLVAGRHTKGLGMLEVLLGNSQPLTLSQRFYQRALCADSHEIIADARVFLRTDSLAAYCDRVVIPALHLAELDARDGTTSSDQQMKIRRVAIDVAAALSGDNPKILKRRHRGAVLEEMNAGRWLRRQRELRSGKWQGPLGAPPGSIVICMGLGSAADDLATELLVRLLRIEKIDARHFSPGEIGAGLPPGADPGAVAIVFLVSAFPGPERGRADSIGGKLRELLAQANIVRVYCPGVAAATGPAESGHADPTAGSLREAVEICGVWDKARCESRSHQRSMQPA